VRDKGVPSCGIKASLRAAEGIPSCGLYRGVPARRNPFVQPKESPLRVQAAAVWDSPLRRLVHTVNKE
jgi:hypothetical protein